MKDIFSLDKSKSTSTVVKLFAVYNVKDKSGSFRYLLKLHVDSVQLSIVRKCLTTAAQLLFQESLFLIFLYMYKYCLRLSDLSNFML